MPYVLDDRHAIERAGPPISVSIETLTWPLPCLFVLVSCEHGETAGMLDRGSPRSDRRGMERRLVERHRREKRCDCGCAGPAGAVPA
jgi:hypothetical protein